jgi:hypothetical protein
MLMMIKKNNVDPTGDSLNFYYNTTGTYFTDNDYSSYFSLNSNVETNTGLVVEPFIRVYNRMFKNGANTAMDLKTFGNANNNVNSDVLIRLDSGSDPTPGANSGKITTCLFGSYLNPLPLFAIGSSSSTAGNSLPISCNVCPRRLGCLSAASNAVARVCAACACACSCSICC